MALNKALKIKIKVVVVTTTTTIIIIIIIATGSAQVFGTIRDEYINVSDGIVFVVV